MADQLRAIGADVTRHDTNMLFVRVGDEQARALGEFMQARGVLKGTAVTAARDLADAMGAERYRRGAPGALGEPGSHEGAAGREAGQLATVTSALRASAGGRARARADLLPRSVLPQASHATAGPRSAARQR